MHLWVDFSAVMLNYPVMCQRTSLLHSILRGVFMDIQRDGTQVYAFIGSDELSDMGLSFETLRERDISSRIFLAAVRAHIMNDLGCSSHGDIRISKCTDGVRLALTVSLHARFISDPAEVIGYLADTCTDTRIYRLNGRFVLVPRGCDEVEEAKIKEHGRLLSHTPRNVIQT